MAYKISLTPKERNVYLREGVNFLRDSDPTIIEEGAENHVNEIIEQCIDPDIYGWKTAPNSFRKRFEVKMGMNKKNRGIHCTKKRKINNSVKKYRIDLSLAKEIIDIGVFDDDETKYIRNKVKEYQKEFVFNSTSDKHLLMNLIIEEVKLMRLNKKYFASDEIEKRDLDARKFCQNNILKFQEALNITRQQRDSELEKGAKSIAELSRTLEMKIDKWSDEEYEEYLEELRFDKQRLTREPINLPLALEEIEAVLASSDRDELSGEDLLLKNQLDLQKKDEASDAPNNEEITLPNAVKRNG